jgi:phage shock protein C
MTTVNAPLRRSRSHRVIAGVIGGLAEYFDIDVALARILYVIVSVCSAAFPGILVYIICWILIPQESDERPRTVST